MSEQSEAPKANKSKNTESAKAEKTGPQYAVGDTITVMRGLDRGKSAKVMGVDEKNQQYAVQFPDGAFSVVNFVNTKPPTEGTVTESTLVSVFTEALQTGERDILAVAARLDAHLADFSSKLPAA